MNSCRMQTGGKLCGNKEIYVTPETKKQICVGENLKERGILILLET
jgi:hypothetical protein